jgi:hypothetical protein
MKGNEGEIEGRGWRMFNEPCLGDFLSGRRKDLRALGGVSYPSKLPIFNSPNWILLPLLKF